MTKYIFFWCTGEKSMTLIWSCVCVCNRHVLEDTGLLEPPKCFRLIWLICLHNYSARQSNELCLSASHKHQRFQPHRHADKHGGQSSSPSKPPQTGEHKLHAGKWTTLPPLIKCVSIWILGVFRTYRYLDLELNDLTFQKATLNVYEGGAPLWQHEPWVFSHFELQSHSTLKINHAKWALFTIGPLWSM